MKPWFKQQFLDELRSRRWTQIQQNLFARGKPGRSALGVAVEAAISCGLLRTSSSADEDGYPWWAHRLYRYEITACLQNECGLVEWQREVLVEMNDVDALPFPMIASIVEEWPATDLD